jgi:hypothetical protein
MDLLDVANKNSMPAISSFSYQDLKQQSMLLARLPA